MNTALLVARLVLAAVFLTAGGAKLADLRGSHAAVRGFGIPRPFSAPVAILLPLIEIAIAVALVPTRIAWGASIAALALLLLFMLAIGVNLARGRRPDCHCFGQLHSEPAGWSTLARNGVLGAIAAFVMVEGRSHAGLSALSWLQRLTGTERVGLGITAILVLFLCAQSWVMLNLIRQNGRFLGRLEALEGGAATGIVQVPSEPEAPAYGLPVGAAAPAFSLSGLYGEVMTLDAFRAQGRPTLLLFTDPGCGPCLALMPDIAKWQREQASLVSIALISRGPAEDLRAKTGEHGVINVLMQEDHEVSTAYGSPGTPCAVAVLPDGTIAEPMAVGAEAITGLVRRLATPVERPAEERESIPLLAQIAAPAPAPVNGNGHTAPAPAPGDMAPTFKLPDLGGRTVRLSDFRGTRILLLFWNMNCGFCQQMLSDLREWEQSRPRSAPKVLVISSGSIEENRAAGLRSTVLLDQSFATGNAFGASGTPMAVMIDSEGRIASEVAAGAPGVFALLAGSPDAQRLASV